MPALILVLLSCLPSLRGEDDPNPDFTPDPKRPEILVEPAVLEFGLAGWTLSREITVMNVGKAELHVVDVLDEEPFTVDFSGPFVLAPGELRVLEVLYEAQDYGIFEGELQVESDDVEHPLTLVEVSATNPWPELVVPPLVQFEPTGVRCEEEASFVIANRGTSDLTVSDVVLSSDSTELYIQAKNLPWTLAPGEERDLRLFYEPHDEGEDEAEVLFLSNDPDKPTHTSLVRGSATWEDAC